MTRATVAALHGHWSESVHYHPLALLVVPLFGLYVGAHAVSYIRHGKSNVDQVLATRWVTVVSVLIFTVMLAVWIARFFGAFGGPAPV